MINLANIPSYFWEKIWLGLGAIISLGAAAWMIWSIVGFSDRKKEISTCYVSYTCIIVEGGYGHGYGVTNGDCLENQHHAWYAWWNVTTEPPSAKTMVYAGCHWTASLAFDDLHLYVDKRRYECYDDICDNPQAWLVWDNPWPDDYFTMAVMSTLFFGLCCSFEIVSWCIVIAQMRYARQQTKKNALDDDCEENDFQMVSEEEIQDH